MTLIGARGLTKTYGNTVHALDRVSFSVGEGEWVAVMGPSGSGKSTLLNILGCLDSPTEGKVYLDSVDLTELPKAELARLRAEKIGFVFQHYHLIPYLTALENVMLAQYFHSLADEKEAAEALRRVGLGGRLDHLPSQLAGGEQQRVCVARALINQPNLILADEPTGNLDSKNSEVVLQMLRQLNKDLGQTIVMITHNPEATTCFDRVVHMRDGVIVDGIPAD